MFVAIVVRSGICGAQLMDVFRDSKNGLVYSDNVDVIKKRLWGT